MAEGTTDTPNPLTAVASENHVLVLVEVLSETRVFDDQGDLFY
jgi:hypothetical protein